MICQIHVFFFFFFSVHFRCTLDSILNMITFHRQYVFLTHSMGRHLIIIMSESFSWSRPKYLTWLCIFPQHWDLLGSQEDRWVTFTLHLLITHSIVGRNSWLCMAIGAAWRGIGCRFYIYCFRWRRSVHFLLRKLWGCGRWNGSRLTQGSICAVP